MAAERIAIIDAVRGFAVMGILLMNVVAFGLPSAAYADPAALGPVSLADTITWAIAFVLIDGKMRALFAFLFGASMLLVIDRAAASGRSPARTHYARMATLFLFGIAHFTLVWFGDILMMYAVIGSIAILFASGTTRQLVRWGVTACVVSALIYMALALAIWQVRAEASQPGASSETIASWTQTAAEIGRPTAQAIAKEAAIARGSWRGMVADRVNDQSDDAVQTIEYGAFETFGLMLLGMAGLRSGFLRGEWPRHRYRRWAITCYAIGLPPTVAVAALAWRSGFDPLTLYVATFVVSPLFHPILMIAHASALITLLKRGSGRATERLAATGRMALSNYLGTSLLMTNLFYGNGLSWFGTLSRWQLYLIAPLVWALILVWSKPWLDRFRYGPFEWLWRTLAQGQMQPMRR